uniref:PHD finger protein 8 n=1 Tax=Taeniopygia guttata TaxID=59729 RepID=A0A674GV22_TAEGU
MASVPVYCLCRLPYDVTRFMIECDGCQDWFHGSCVGVEEEAAAEIDLYHCPQCAVLRGPSVMKRRRGPAKAPEQDPGRPARTGSAQFIRELRGRTFPSADEVLLRPSGAQLTVEYLEENSFSVPILVARHEGLGMTLPPPSFTPRDVLHHVGADKVVAVLDVGRQAELRMRLGDFVAYLGGPRRERVLSVTGLEFSDTRLSNLVQTPRIVRKLSWVENLWPGESARERPSVQKFCLMGAKDSYSDFHIDCGGTSAWYHVLRGEQIFYLARPSAANLALFEAWSSSRNQPELFFGDQVDRCFRCHLRQGQTLFIPTGWIHAVLTPVDSLAFGGHFLHSLNIGMQLRAYELQRRLNTPDLAKFPNFETICWYVGRHLLDTFRGLRENRRHPAAYLVLGARALTGAFRAWTRREVLAEHEQEIPETVRPGQLVKELGREIRLAEVNWEHWEGLGRTGGNWDGMGSAGRDLKCTGKGLGATGQPLGARLGAVLGVLGGVLRRFWGYWEELGLGDGFWGSQRSLGGGCWRGSGMVLVGQGGGPRGVWGVPLTPLPLRPRRSRPGGLWGSRPPPSPPCSPPSSPLDLDSEEELQIDETPPRRGPRRLPRLPRKLPRAKPCSDPNRVREPGEVDFDIEEDYTTDEEDEGGAGGSAGILDLLKASRQVGGSEYPQLSEAPASPSTREAIQGMLCMANLPAGTPLGPPNWWGGGGGTERGGPGGSGGPRRAPPAPRSTDSEAEGSLDEQDSLGACFKDAEYIYPSLESDEDDPALKSLPKKKKVTDDAPWSPKARVTPSLPRQSRPVREGTRVASVETGLAAAAAKLAQQEEEEEEEEDEEDEDPEVEPEGDAEAEAELGGGEAEAEPPPEPPPEPPYPPSLADHEYTARPGGPGPPPGAQPGRAPTPMAPGVFLSQRRGPPGTAPPSHGEGWKRPRKGLATAKQRLGRILKIHRNGKLLL